MLQNRTEGLFTTCINTPPLKKLSIQGFIFEGEPLFRRAAKYTLPYFEVARARMILHAADGLANDEIARRLDTRREVVSLWRKRFFTERR